MRQFNPRDDSSFSPRYGSGQDGSKTISADETYDGANAGLVGSYTADPLVQNPTITINAISTFSNGQLILIHQTRGGSYGAWEINKIKSGGGTTSLELEYPLQNNYADDGSPTGPPYDFSRQAQVLEMKQYSDVTIDSTKTWSAAAWNGNIGGIIAFFVNGTLDVNGILSATAKGFRGGQRTDVSGNGGESVQGYAAYQQPNLNAGGGGSKAESGAGGGGGGGGGTAGNNGQTIGSGVGGTGGTVAGLADLTNMVFGGGGGMGGDGWLGGTNGPGGRGGGIVLAIAKIVDVDNATGSIVANGSNGGNGDTAHQKAAAGGGGAGGSIDIKGQTLTLNTTRVSASGGFGGSQGWSNNGAGGNGNNQNQHSIVVIREDHTPRSGADTNASLQAFFAGITTTIQTLHTNGGGHVDVNYEDENIDTSATIHVGPESDESK